jgi:PBP1b-binding outer membrane lipoprotein LpoB
MKILKISRLSLVCALALALAGCNSSNYVETLTPESSVVKHMDVKAIKTDTLTSTISLKITP